MCRKNDDGRNKGIILDFIKQILAFKNEMILYKSKECLVHYSFHKIKLLYRVTGMSFLYKLPSNFLVIGPGKSVRCRYLCIELGMGFISNWPDTRPFIVRYPAGYPIQYPAYKIAETGTPVTGRIFGIALRSDIWYPDIWPSICTFHT